MCKFVVMENSKLDEIVFAIKRADLQEEANYYLGREMNEEEYLRAKKLFEFGIGENIRFIYREIFLQLID